MNQTDTTTPKDREIFTSQHKYHFSHHWVHANDLTDVSNALNEKDILQQFSILSTNTSSHRTAVMPEQLPQQWGIGMENAKATLKVTT
jgi:hypothetical protein